MKIPAPNRLAVYLTAFGGLLTALAPIVADLDVTSTAGVIGGFAGIAVVVNKWLTGWQNLEKAEAQNTLHALTTDREIAAQQELAALNANKPRYGGNGIKLPGR